MRSKYIGLILLCVIFSHRITGQENATLLYNEHFDLNASRLIPSKLGSDYTKFKISLFYLQASIANNSITGNNIFTLKPTNQRIDEAIDNMGAKNHLTSVDDVMPLAISFSIRKKDTTNFLSRDLVTISFGLTERAAATFTYSKNFMELAWRGNKQFAGETIELGPLSLNALYSREYFLGIALPIVHTRNFDMRLGARFRYLQGIAAAYMPVHQATFYTQEEGKYIEIDPDYRIHIAGVRDDFNPIDFNGHGFGLDISTSIMIKERIGLHLSFLDIGNVNFKNATRQISNNVPVRYDGLIFTGFFGGSVEVGLDSLETILNSEIEDDVPFKMPLSTRMILQGEYKTPVVSRKGRLYHSHSFFITYIQGFKEMTRSTTKPFLGIAYSHSFNSVFNLGGNIGFGGTAKFNAGLFFSIRTGVFRFGLGSGNLTGLFAKSSGAGLDFTFNLTFTSRN